MVLLNAQHAVHGPRFPLARHYRWHVRIKHKSIVENGAQTGPARSLGRCSKRTLRSSRSLDDLHKSFFIMSVTVGV